MAYAKRLTKEDLQKAGVTYVSPLGDKIRCGYTVLNQYDQTNGYKRVKINNVTYGVHRIVYAWWNNEVPEGMVVDHKNNDKSDNCLFNLQILTPGENIYKDRECNVIELKCNLKKPRSFYEEKLTNYLYQYMQAKLDKNADLVHKLRSNLSHTRARIRYYDHHIEEFNKKMKT